MKKISGRKFCIVTRQLIACSNFLPLEDFLELFQSIFWLLRNSVGWWIQISLTALITIDIFSFILGKFYFGLFLSRNLKFIRNHAIYACESKSCQRSFLRLSDIVQLSCFLIVLVKCGQILTEKLRKDKTTIKAKRQQVSDFSMPAPKLSFFLIFSSFWRKSWELYDTYKADMNLKVATL